MFWNGICRTLVLFDFVEVNIEDRCSYQIQVLEWYLLSSVELYVLVFMEGHKQSILKLTQHIFSSDALLTPAIFLVY